MAVSTFRPDTWYRFTLPNRPGYSLDIINDGHAHEDGKLQIAPTGNYSGQFWQLIRSPSDRYRIRTMYTGPDMYLTVRDEDNLDPHLTAESGKVGRLWHIVPCGNGTVKIKLNVSGRDYWLGSKHDTNWSRSQRPVLSHQEDQTQVWKAESVRPIGELSFDTAQRITGWVHKWDSDSQNDRYLNLFTLKWQTTEPEESADSSAVNWIPRFYPWSPEIVESSARTFPEYLDNDSNDVTVIDVSRGFSFPRLVERSEDLQLDDHHTQPQIPDYPETYAYQSILVSTHTSSEGAKLLFYISKGVHFTRQSVVSVQDPATETPDWICGIMRDTINFTISPVDLRQVGLEDDLPNGFTWCKRGVDVEFRPQESVPLKHLTYLGHGGQAVVDKVFCNCRMLARKQIRIYKPSAHSAALRELEAIRKVQDHAHVVRIVGYYTQGNILGILLHPAAECDLQTALERFEDPDSGYFTERAPYRYFKSRFLEGFGCLANGLAFMHGQGIRHRDIKPRNILLTFDGPLYTDFGIARDFSDNQASTTTGPTTRTYDYCAPEVADSAQRGRSSDVFSLGCVFLEMFVVFTEAATLKEGRSRRDTDGDQSYHANLDKVKAWVGELIAEADATPLGSWKVQLLSVIMEMLRWERDARPSPEAVLKITQEVTLDLDGVFKGHENICGKCCLNGFVS